MIKVIKLVHFFTMKYVINTVKNDTIKETKFRISIVRSRLTKPVVVSQNRMADIMKNVDIVEAIDSNKERSPIQFIFYGEKINNNGVEVTKRVKIEIC